MELNNITLAGCEIKSSNTGISPKIKCRLGFIDESGKVVDKEFFPVANLVFKNVDLHITNHSSLLSPAYLRLSVEKASCNIEKNDLGEYSINCREV